MRMAFIDLSYVNKKDKILFQVIMGFKQWNLEELHSLQPHLSYHRFSSNCHSNQLRRFQ